MTLSHPPASLSGSSLIGPAEVLEQGNDGEFIRVRRPGSWDCTDGWARLAIGQNVRLQVGDQVLVAGEPPDEMYVIGLLGCTHRPRLNTSSGVYAECSGTRGEETLRVLTADDELLFEWNPATRSTRVAVPEGNLEFVATRGNLVFRAAGHVHVEGQSIQLNALHRLALSVSAAVQQARSWLTLLPHSLQAKSEQVELSADRTQLRSAATELTSERLTVESLHHQVRSEKIETTAETIVERSGSRYQTVRELIQVQAGRLRTYVTGMSHFRSKRAYFSAQETFHVDGDKVHLG